MAEEMANMKPACGSGEEVGEYDLPLHVVALFLVMGFSCLGAGFPVVAKKVKWMKIPPKVFFACKHFGTGVLIATAFVHLLPTAFASLMDPCLPDFFTDIYPPITGVIMMAALFALFVIEMTLNHKMGGQAHSHGGNFGTSAPAAPTMAPERPPRYNHQSYETDVSFEKKVQQQVYADQERFERLQPNPFGDDAQELAARSEMPPWFIVFYEQYVRQRMEMVNIMKGSQPQVSVQPTYNVSEPSKPAVGLIDSPYIDVETGLPVDEMTYKKMSMNITLLEGGILFHSVFVGMTVSITIEGFIILLIAILFHQMFEGLGLGTRIAAVPYAKGSIRPWVLVFAFGTTAPIGQAIGLITRNTYDPNSAFGLIIVGIFNAISSGLLLYAATVDLLAEDFLSEEAQHTLTKKDKITAFSYVLLGATGMSIVGGFA
ncbi:zinc-regulated transporter 2 [Diaporthe amygdali]|uniref:zinc-regulated transporter 2 n=1 Tax=Phomopsis amygdali TaxID=1214568 RepID=UPI0022FF4133|nr:zinc-regulated transporter 2 [Diaporthe amygdali]KAJ0119770.1 zinc-regulated transporter 2 [Diaporthe amygdali]